jgi:dipeptide/tripeptide permease
MLIPMLAGLLNRKVTWRGAAAGIAAGFASGISFYLLKTLVLARRPGIDANWLRYDFEAITILANFGITVAAMAIATILEKPTASERARIDRFFERLDTPIQREPAAAQKPEEMFSPFYIIGWITCGVGVLLAAAGLTLAGGGGRTINVAVGLGLLLAGCGFHALNRRFIRMQAELKGEAPSA